MEIYPLAFPVLVEIVENAMVGWDIKKLFWEATVSPVRISVIVHTSVMVPCWLIVMLRDGFSEAGDEYTVVPEAFFNVHW